MKKLLLILMYIALLTSWVSCSQSESGFFELHSFDPGVPIISQREFSLNQDGTYLLEISTKNPPPNPVNPKEYGFMFTYRVNIGGKEVKRGQLSNLAYPWWGTEGKAGFILEWLQVPKDLPKNSKLSVTYEILVDEKFILSFGNQLGVGISKSSDK